MIYYVSIRAHVLDDKSSETDVFCDFGLSTKRACEQTKYEVISISHNKLNFPILLHII